MRSLRKECLGRIWLGKQSEQRLEVGEELSLFEKHRKDQCVQREMVIVAEMVSRVRSCSTL